MSAIQGRAGRQPELQAAQLGASISTGDGELDRLAGDDLVYGVGQLEQHAVRSWGQADQDHCLAAGIDEMPGCIVDGDVDVADTRRHVERTLAEHRHDTKVFCSILNENLAGSQRPCKRRVDDQLWWRLILDGNKW